MLQNLDLRRVLVLGPPAPKRLGSKANPSRTQMLRRFEKDNNNNNNPDAAPFEKDYYYYYCKHFIN